MSSKSGSPSSSSHAMSLGMSPTTPRRGIRRQNAILFSPEKSEKSPGIDSLASRMNSLGLPPSSKKSSMSPGSTSPSSERTLLWGGKPRRTIRSPMKSPTSTSTSGTSSKSSKSKSTSTSSMTSVMKGMKKQIMKSVVMKVMIKGKGKKRSPTTKDRKMVKKDKTLKPKTNKFGWAPSSEMYFVFNKNFFKGWRAAPGQVKMLHQDLGDAWQEHRELVSYNKSHGAGAGSLKTFTRGFIMEKGWERHRNSKGFFWKFVPEEGARS